MLFIGGVLSTVAGAFLAYFSSWPESAACHAFGNMFFLAAYLTKK